MENASKALVIAGGVLITILVVSLFILFVNQVSDFEKFGILSGAPEAEEKAVFFTVGGECEQYYADFKHSKYGNVRWIFSPDEKMLNAIKLYLKHTLK
mgnify:CR=1 FL=1